MDAIRLSVFSNRVNGICEEMGEVLRNASFSPNIQDRLDFSCALFDRAGKLLAQAAHIPVHLGSMAYAMSGIVHAVDWHPGDMIILNSPYLGGTHLPDVTVVMPVFFDQSLCGFVTNRAHHANIGCETPGSMPVSRHIDEEGLLIPPTRIVNAFELDELALSRVLGMGERAISEEKRNRQVSSEVGDVFAQISANRAGHERLTRVIHEMGVAEFDVATEALNDYGERLSRLMIQRIPDGDYEFSDVLDSDGAGTCDIGLHVKLTVETDQVTLDFQASSTQVPGNVNCPASVTAAASFYVFRCLLPDQVPSCDGVFRPIRLLTRKGTVLDAEYPAAVAAGNVETSSRVVDLVLGALAQALPEEIPAASQGTMNNIAMGSERDDTAWNYYETIAGGTGAGKRCAGLHGRHSHMTNTLNTPIESLETHFPLRVMRYSLRRESGGQGLHAGGDGVIRAYEILDDTTVTLLTERRSSAPWGSAGGKSGRQGENLLNGRVLPDKICIRCTSGDILEVQTPGGGGWGNPDSNK